MDNKISKERNKARGQFFGILSFLILTTIWGFAFVPQKMAVEMGIGPITLNGLRSLLGAVALIPVIAIADKIKGKKFSLLGVTEKADKKAVLIGGLICGLCLTAGSTFQQIGVKYTSVGKAGFLSALYIILVPLFTLFFGKKINWNGWTGVVIAFFGMFMLCFDLKKLDNLVMNKGDFLIIICSICFSIHILCIDKFAKKIDPIRLSCLQFFVCGTICTLLGLIFEASTWVHVPKCLWCIAALGIGSCAIGYTLQTIGQIFVPAHIAPLLMGLESIFSLVAGWVCFGEILKIQQYLGCALILIAVILAQVDFSAFKKKKVGESIVDKVKIEDNQADGE